MTSEVSLGRALAREVLLALLVLALFFLNFGQASVVLADGGQVSVTQTIFCGGPVGDDQSAHPVTCHACRPHLPVLEPPQDDAVAVCFGVTPVVYADSTASEGILAPLLIGPPPRGPPASI